MINPFEKIVAPDPGAPEEVGGEFQCQQCFTTSNRAYYFEEKDLVIWTCPDGHRNSVEGVNFD